MASASTEEALSRVIQCLEEQLRALTRSPQVLSQQPSNMQKYIDIATTEGTIQNNAPRKRARDILRAVKAHSMELFVLCAVATNQNILGTVKWGRKEIFEVCGWWDKIVTPTEIEILQRIWQESTQETRAGPLPMCDPVPGAWLIDALKGNEDATLLCDWNAGTIKMNDKVKQSLLTISIMRSIVRN